MTCASFLQKISLRGFELKSSKIQSIIKWGKLEIGIRKGMFDNLKLTHLRLDWMSVWYGRAVDDGSAYVSDIAD